MSGQTWSKFYWSDWRSDPRLRMCGLTARGLWIEMLALMSEADPFGHLIIAGQAPTDAQLAVLVGAPLDEVQASLAELESTGVFSHNQKGVIYSRRMTQDEKKAKLARKNGKAGGNPTLCKTTENSALDNQPNNQTVKGSLNTHKPEANSQKPESLASPAIDGKALDKLGCECLAIFGLPRNLFMGHFGPLLDLKRYPATDEEIIEAAKRIAARPTFSLKGNPIALLAKAGRDEIDKIRSNSRTAPADFVDPAAAKWRQRVDRFKNASGFWSDSWGPKPGETGCECPAEILAEFGYGRAA